MPDIAYTLGEPAGIGPDIIIALAQTRALTDVVCVGDARVLRSRADKLGLPLALLDEQEPVTKAGQLRVLQVDMPEPEVLGTPSIANAAALLTMLDVAIAGCQSQRFAAMVTGPLHKGVINDANISFSGHTEYLAEKTVAPLPVMLLASDTLRVALITTHMPLKAVSESITRQRIQVVCRVIHSDLQSKYRIDQPRLLVCGLNPHAGEGGHLGREEIDVIIPALDELRAEGLTIEGPLPADTLFTPRVLARGDVAVAMYHDQGLPVLKYQGFGNAANITLGLPIIRTSVDHGTALDIAGSGLADTGSLEAALAAAEEFVTKG